MKKEKTINEKTIKKIMKLLIEYKVIKTKK